METEKQNRDRCSSDDTFLSKSTFHNKPIELRFH